MSGPDKNTLNIRELERKAGKGDKSFLYYDNSKSKINSIIRKNKLKPFVIEYLWKSKIYKKEIIKHQTLSDSIRRDIIEQCINHYPDSPWVSILRNFIKNHNPTEHEMKSLLFSEKQTSNLVLECWETKPLLCYRIGAQDLLYNIISSSSKYRNEYVSRRMNSILIKIFNQIDEMQIEVTRVICNLKNSFIIRDILTPLFKTTKVQDNVVDFLISELDVQTFKLVINPAIQRSNISDNMMAKILLAFG